MTQPFKIAMSSYYLPSESKIGAGYMAHRLANTLQQRGHSVTMYSPCSRPTDAEYDHVHTPLTGSLRTFRWANTLRRLDLSCFDLLHAHGDNHLRMRWSAPPVVRTMHGSCFSEALRIHGTKERLRMLLLGCTEVAGSITAARTIAVSRATTRGYPWSRNEIPNGADLAPFLLRQKAPMRDPSIRRVFGDKRQTIVDAKALANASNGQPAPHPRRETRCTDWSRTERELQLERGRRLVRVGVPLAHHRGVALIPRTFRLGSPN